MSSCVLLALVAGALGADAFVGAPGALLPGIHRRGQQQQQQQQGPGRGGAHHHHRRRYAGSGGAHHHQPAKDLLRPPSDPVQRRLFELLSDFTVSGAQEYMLPATLTAHQRRVAHSMAELFGLGHRTCKDSKGRSTCVRVWRKDRLFAAVTDAHTGAAHAGARQPSNRQGAEKVDPRLELCKKAVDAWGAAEQDIYDRLVQFAASHDKVLSFEPALSSEARKVVHALAEEFELEHTALGRPPAGRFIRVAKIDPKVLVERRQDRQHLQLALEQYKNELSRSSGRLPAGVDAPASPLAAWTPTPSNSEDGSEDIGDEVDAGATLRYCNFNIEWMDHWFASETEMHAALPELPDVADIARRAAGVIEELDPDLLAVEEGPRTRARMVLFVDTFLGGRYDVIGGLDPPSNTQQLYFLVKRGGPLRNARVHQELQAFVTRPWIFDVNGDCKLEEYTFTRVPLCIVGEVVLAATASSVSTDGDAAGPGDAGAACEFFAVCAHTKSKFINGGRRLWDGDEREKGEYIHHAVANRRRIAAECARVRKAINEVLFDREAQPLIIVSGDLNDGPGMDFFEQYYLLTNSVEQLLGSPFSYRRILNPLLVRRRWVPIEEQWSCVFDDFVDGVTAKRCLIDHLCVSTELMYRTVRASVAHDVFNQYVCGPGRERWCAPSDHRPVFADFSLAPGPQAP